MIKLGVNIDHVATVRQARRETFPDPVAAAQEAVAGGAEGITAHLREDRRHIQDDDIRRLKKNLSVPLNMEMAVSREIVAMALDVRPAWCCLVPEKRQELTTEGGLNVTGNEREIEAAVSALKKAGVKISLFIEPDVSMVQASMRLGADAVELHTGKFSKMFALGEDAAVKIELERIHSAAKEAKKGGLLVNAGHGIDYENVAALTALFPFNEFNIGFAVIGRSFFVGMKNAVQEMKLKLRV